MPVGDATGVELCPKLAHIRLLKSIKGFDCGYEGQTGGVYRVNGDGSLHCILKCGHPLTITEEDIGSLVEVEWVERPKVEEKTMSEKTMKQNKIPNAGGVIQVQGYEDEVKSFVTDSTFFKQMEKRLDEVKAKFRELAKQAEANSKGADVTRVEFIAEDGSCVPVSFADITKDSNRNAVSEKAYKAALKLGFDLNELGVSTTEESFLLTGEWVAWFKGVLQSYEQQGQPAPEGFTHKEVVKLSVEGIAKLRKMAREGKTDEEKKAAELLLNAGIKASSVSVKR